MNQRSNKMKRKRRDANRIREDTAVWKAHSVHEAMIKAQGGGDIAPNEPDIIVLSENTLSFDMLINCTEDKYLEDQGQYEGCGVRIPVYSP